MHEKFKIKTGDHIRLSQLETKGSQHFFKSEAEAKEMLVNDVKKMQHLQQKMYAEGKKAILIIFQGMDTAGKDSCIRHIFSGINPQGCSVTSFKQPTAAELAHDFMWRHYAALPLKGFISIFNRSYYENVLVTRVHPQLLLKESLPGIATTDDVNAEFWDKRFETINSVEKQLTASGTTILKFFLHISKKEQKSRLLQRINDDDKNWKFNYSDLGERKLWDKYQDAYGSMLSHTSVHNAHWYAIPADEKWFSRVAISRIIVHALEEINVIYPVADSDKRKQLVSAAAALNDET
ncbi:PPK2 family polyphosphate kinase [Flavihumibacter stibioxidans]|uniref:Polyphosphate--nucleotide phosphotransferase n=1 Tax=Flavihumibacter stibioxidans TaxID=1834163 RepID=A0ABR7M482_9BACT|nr:PPK2 family polyphosphate kinase [Flavihumibacter stibioxidans]MBC6489659.1 polyphosphate--nucleotide phosphotransferase [Flavihumibacter stibioxidans]